MLHQQETTCPKQQRLRHRTVNRAHEVFLVCSWLAVEIRNRPHYSLIYKLHAKLLAMPCRKCERQEKTKYTHPITALADCFFQLPLFSH